MASRNPVVWCADVITKVRPCAPLAEATPGEEADYAKRNDLWDAASSTLRLSGAANEVLVFQLAVERRAGAIESAALAGGGVTPKLALYVNIPMHGRDEEEPTYDALYPLKSAGVGEPPRALARLLRVKGAKRQLYTVELYIPRGAPAGRHNLELVLTLAKAGEVRLAVDLTVFDFELTGDFAATPDLNAYGGAIARWWPKVDPLSDEYLKIEQAFFRMAHEHGGVFHLLPYAHSGRVEKGYVPILEGRGRTRRVKDWAPFDRHWGPYLDGSAFAGTRRGATPVPYMYLPINLNWPAYFEKYGTPGYELEFKNVVREFAVHFAEKGWTKTKFEVFFNHKARWKYYPWDMDEIRFERDNKATLHLARLADEAVEGVEGPQFINRIDSSWIFSKSATCELGDAVNLWIVNQNFLAPFPDEAEALRKKGQEVWFYGGSNKLAAPSRLFNLQWPWMAWGRGVDGFTYWNAIGWTANVWENAGSGHDYILYPGERFGIGGPLPSLRLKTAYRGLQDVGYLQTLTERTGSRAAADAITAEHLGCERGREDWWQRGEYPGLSGSEIRAHNFSPRAWKEKPRTAWNAARAALGRAIEKA